MNKSTVTASLFSMFTMCAAAGMLMLEVCGWVAGLMKNWIEIMVALQCK